MQNHSWPVRFRQRHAPCPHLAVGEHSPTTQVSACPPWTPQRTPSAVSRKDRLAGFLKSRLPETCDPSHPALPLPFLLSHQHPRPPPSLPTSPHSQFLPGQLGPTSHLPRPGPGPSRAPGQPPARPPPGIQESNSATWKYRPRAPPSSESPTVPAPHLHPSLLRWDPRAPLPAITPWITGCGVRRAEGLSVCWGKGLA